MADDLRGSSVLVVDDAPENLQLLAAVLRRGGFIPRPVASGRLAIGASVADPPDLVLLDVRMPGMSGLEVCRWFKHDERLRSIPIIFISGLQRTDDKVEALSVGGVDYVSKPFQPQEVLARVETHLRLRQLQVELVSHNLLLEQRVAEQVKAVTASQLATIFALAKLAETRDDDTGQHIERVQTFSRELAERMREMTLQAAQLTPAFIDNLHQTASLHDIGKVGTPDAILLKPGKLTTAEFAEMKKHTVLGANTLATVLKRHPMRFRPRWARDLSWEPPRSVRALHRRVVCALEFWRPLGYRSTSQVNSPIIETLFGRAEERAILEHAGFVLLMAVREERKAPPVSIEMPKAAQMRWVVAFVGQTGVMAFALVQHSVLSSSSM